LHKGDRRKETTKTVRETEAEAVAFVVCTALGLATNGSAINYIQLYDGDAELLMASLALVQQTATSILNAISDTPKQQSSEAAPTEPVELPIAA
jgi:hypothetical protein